MMCFLNGMEKHKVNEEKLKLIEDTLTVHNAILQVLLPQMNESSKKMLNISLAALEKSSDSNPELAGIAAQYRKSLQR